MNKIEKKELVIIINQYLTPLAFFLVLLSIIFSEPTGRELYGSIALLIISLLNNLITVQLVDKIKWISLFRMILNVIVNIFLVYFLVGYWEPIWYLFLLTPVATAVYSTRPYTFIISLVMSGILLGIYAFRGLNGSVAWGQAACKAILIIFLSMFINTLTNKCYK